MTAADIGPWLVIGAVLAWGAAPLGAYVARVLDADGRWPRHGRRVEALVYRIAGVDPTRSMPWWEYAAAMLAFNAVGLLATYVLQRLQGVLPLNSNGIPAPSPASAFNTAASFVSNTNWQGYAGERAMSHLTQMLGLTVQNFASAATGMAILGAVARGLRQREDPTLGNFWADVVRSTLYVLLPLATVLAIALASQGVVQTLQGSVTVPLLERVTTDDGAAAVQTIPLGPVASQVAIKQLGTNGGGFYNANAAHPFENPTPLTNVLEWCAILLLPMASCHTLGAMLRDRRHGWALFATMALLFLPACALIVGAELHTNPRLAELGTTLDGNAEGKEVRFGIVASALWAAATTAASNGSVNAMHDSFMALGGLGMLFLMQMGEVVFGGVGSGLYGLVVFAIIAVFVAGLMVGRAPEYLGKKIEPFEMKMAALAILVPCVLTLGLTATAVLLPSAVAARGNPGPHGFTEILYACTSMANNNGSAFAGLGADIPFYNLAGGLAMLIARYWVAIPTLALAGALGAKRITPAGAGTLPTHTPLFVVLLAGIVLLVGALTFIPALAIGPIVEHLQLADGSR